MPVALRLDFSKLGLDDHDAVCAALNFPADWPDGILAHGASEVDGRLAVVDVWESRQHFDRFVEGRLQGAMGKTLAIAPSRRRSPRRRSIPSTQATSTDSRPSEPRPTVDI